MIVKLPDICEIKTGKMDANHATKDGKYRFYTCASNYSMCDTNSFSGPCVIVPGNGDIGLVFYYDGEFEAYQRTYVLQNIKINPKYLYYHLLYKWRYVNSDKQFGSTVRYVRMSNFTSYELEVYSEEEQERIVTKIEELLSQLDDGVETLKKTKEQLKVYRQAVLQDAFKNCDEKILIRDICEHVTDGDHMPPPKTNEGIPFIMISNIENNRINWNGTAFVGNEYFEAIDSKRKPQKGDILYTVTGSFGIPVLVDFEKEFCFQRHIALLRPNDRILQKYFYYALQAPDVFAQASRGATGTAQKTVGLGVLRKIIIPYVDSLEKQNEIATEIENRMSVCDYIEQTVNNALLQAEALRQSILKKAFEGEL